MNITKDIFYIGVDDKKITKFEGQFDVENGMSYNSYLIIDEKIAILDSVDANFKDEWISNIKKALNGKKPDYLVISHMEPDHSANLANLVKIYPDITVVMNQSMQKMYLQFFKELPKNVLLVKELDELNLGKHTLKFIFAPMVHWPEVMFSYDMCDKVLFSADAFGKFGSLDYDDPEGWACEARRYYFGIVGKFGAQVQNVLKKLSGYDIKIIAPLHGPVLSDDLSYYLNLYDIWSSYKSETEGVFICYASVYGNTKKACEILASKLEKEGIKVAIASLIDEDFYESVEDAFRYDRLVLASPTYNGGIFPVMENFIDALNARGYKNKKIAFIENGSWAPMARKAMQAKFNLDNVTVLDEGVKILSSVSDANLAEIDLLAKALK